jgi:sulfofructose kinase
MAATAAVAAAAQGGEVEYWGRLGDDSQGRELRAELAARGVQVHAASPPGTQTPTSAVLVADNGERLLAVHLGRLDDSVDGLPLSHVQQAQAVLVDFRWPAGARVLCEAAAKQGLPRVLDGEIGSPEVLRELMPLCDHVVFSAGGLAQFTQQRDVERALRQAASLASGVVGVTLGEQGSAFLIDGAIHRVPGFAVHTVDTNGAGDVFHGIYTLAIAQGLGVIEAARWAGAAAALKCRNGSGWSAVPGLTDVQQLLKDHP